jgi:glycosyltransferase involved in cell wall biosynthesis
MRPSTERVLSVMMPIFNEERTLATILRHTLAQPEVGEVIAVDDGSTDGSVEILERIAASDPRVRVLRQPYNQGKGAALRRAIDEVRLPFALVQDADLEYDPRDYGALLGPLLAERSDVVYGVRGFSGHSSHSFWFVMGNRVVSLSCNVLFNCYISDLETGYKVMRSELWKSLNLSGSRFDIEPDITVRVLRLGYRIHEVPVHYYARSHAEGKKLGWRDGVQALSTLLRLRLASDRKLFGDRRNTTYHRARLEALEGGHPLVINEPTPGAAPDAEHRALAGRSAKPRAQSGTLR